MPSSTLNALLYQNVTGRGCVPCSSVPPACHCSVGTSCIIVEQSCEACAVAKCVPDGGPSQGSKGVSAGAVAGAVVGSLIFLMLVVGAFWFYRRRLRQRREAASAQETKSDAPARAEDVLNRPDPNEKSNSFIEEQSSVRIYTGTSGIINLDPESQTGTAATDGHTRRGSAQSNPFGDNHSIQTTSTGTQSNVIPIALVPPASFVVPSPTHVASAQPSDSSRASSGPMRPARTPDLDLNLSHMDVSRENMTATSGDAQSQRSGISATHNNRASYMSTGSYASDLLNEAPVIVTPTRGTVKQVVGVVKAEVIRTSPTGSPAKDGDALRVPASNRPPVRSPLAASSFGPSDVVHEVAEDEQEVAVRGNPFGDEHSPFPSARSPAPSASTFGSRERSEGPVTPNRYAEENDWSPEASTEGSNGNVRPMSTYTQAASIMGSVIGAEIGDVKRVHLGLRQFTPAHLTDGAPQTASSGVLNTPRTPYRMTSARLIETPPSGNAAGALEQQQQRAMQEIDPSHSRMSLASVVSSTSTKADSILESFPFVPPSPISNRPIRTPPRSPLAQQSFANSNANSNAAQPQVRRDPPAEEVVREAEVSPLPPPPRPVNRKALGMSVASQSSTFSNGLSSFPFQIDSGNGVESSSSSSSPPSSFMGRQRASLDTLALTSDLSSYPLNFDRNAAGRNGTPPPMPKP